MLEVDHLGRLKLSAKAVEPPAQKEEPLPPPSTLRRQTPRTLQGQTKMNSITLKFLKLDHFDEALQLPRAESEGAAGIDVRACLPPNLRTTGWEILPGERVLIPTGLSFEIPPGHEMQIRPRSGLSFRTALILPNSPGTIDSDYRGELKILMGNSGTRPESIAHGDRIAQMVVAPVMRVDFQSVSELTPTGRGDKGFGSTGVS